MAGDETKASWEVDPIERQIELAFRYSRLQEHVGSMVSVYLLVRLIVLQRNHLSLIQLQTV
jgi:hypothetical protein